MRKAFICPTKYVQGEDELLNLGYFVKTFGKKALLIAHKDDVARVQDKLDKTAAQYKVEFVAANFTGECSRQEVARLQQLAKENKCACTIGLGGGKAIDTAKCVAKGEALIICPPSRRPTRPPPTPQCSTLRTARLTIMLTSNRAPA